MAYLEPMWVYEGPVLQFGKIIDCKWTYRSRASSPEEALRNIGFNYKMLHQMTRNAKIELDKKYLKQETKGRVING